MPQESPLTATPTPTLDDTWNIETFGATTIPNLEKYSVPRFSTTSARSAAFASSPPEQGSLSYVNSLGSRGLQIYDGVSWVELGEYMRIRPGIRFLLDDVSTVSSLYQNVAALTVPVVPGTYHIDMTLLYRADTTEDQFYQGNFVFPGVDSRMHLGFIGRGEDATGLGRNGTRVNTQASVNRASGNIVDMRIGGTAINDVLYIDVAGMLQVVGESGNLVFQHRRTGSVSGEGIRTCRGTVLKAWRID